MEKNCQQCNATLIPEFFDSLHEYHRAKFCNEDCYAVYHKQRLIEKLCLFCNKTFEVPDQKRTNEYCSKECRYVDSRNPGATYTGGNGYVYVKVFDHPVACKSRNWMLLHRYIMEKHLGRFLTDAEIVHHRDENPTNNDLGNLQLIANSRDHIRLHNEQFAAIHGCTWLNTKEAITKRAASWKRNARFNSLVL